MNVKQIKKENTIIWTKNWSGNWCLLWGSLYGDIYTKGLKELTGEGFKKFIVAFESGISFNYLNQVELSEYCQHLVSLIKEDPSLPKCWGNQVMSGTDKFFILSKKLENKKSYTKSDYYDLQDLRFAITTADFSIKKVIDYLPKDLVEKYLPLFTKVRLYSEPMYNEADSLLRKVVGYLLNNRLPSQALAALSKEELIEFFASGNLPKEKILLERYAGCALIYDQDGKVKILAGKEFQGFLKKIIAKKYASGIKGTAAYKGFAKGRVKIVFDPRQATDFKTGDILVAGMTRPEYLYLMEKSGAFITDAGGLLSHAAIVAREMKKPCIVGTEIATKVLKDGDLVEVDANIGIVRIINS